MACLFSLSDSSTHTLLKTRFGIIVEVGAFTITGSSGRESFRSIAVVIAAGIVLGRYFRRLARDWAGCLNSTKLHAVIILISCHIDDIQTDNSGRKIWDRKIKYQSEIRKGCRTWHSG
jgi:hypothetical protein